MRVGSPLQAARILTARTVLHARTVPHAGFLATATPAPVLRPLCEELHGLNRSAPAPTGGSFCRGLALSACLDHADLMAERRRTSSNVRDKTASPRGNAASPHGAVRRGGRPDPAPGAGPGRCETAPRTENAGRRGAAAPPPPARPSPGVS
ncbi:MAG: hypothetical protein ACE5ID_01580, partial [Acidobacteriota bacterium]